MRNIMSAEAPRILEDIVHAHNLPDTFRADTANHHIAPGHHTDVRITIRGFDDDRRHVHFSACKGYRPTTHHTRFISTDKDGECFTFAGVTYHAWMFETGEERAAIASDFYAHYRIIDSPVPDVRQTERPSMRGQAMFEHALVMSGLPYGDNVDA